MAERMAHVARGFSLHEALTLIEDKELDVHALTILPPKNAVETLSDEDSGEEDNLDINNLTASQMQSEVEIVTKCVSHDYDSEDEIPLSQLRKFLKAKKKKQYHYVKEDLSFNEVPFDWDNVFMPSEQTPVSLFSLFFDDIIVKHITDETNRYAAQKNRAGRVEIGEIKCFIGILILSGFVPLPRRRMFWQRSKDSYNELVSAAISRNKFEFILSNLHCNDNYSLDKTDKFSKVRPLFTHLKNKFLEHGFLEEEHSVDEAMIPYTGRHGCKQYIHGKPIRYGYKFWVGTTRQGYVNWFEPYQGAATNISQNYKHLGVGAGVVLEYADALKSKWSNLKFHLFFDNFFSSIALLENLIEKNISGTGTIRENRITSSTLPDSKSMKKKSRGYFEYEKVSSSNIIFVRWNDNNIVTFCSNAAGVYPLHSVKRYSQKEKRFIQIDQPHVVQLYNRSMGGVDRSDQNISLYRTSIRGKKWYFPLIAHCIDMAVHNAWQIHKHEGGKMDQLTFRRNIANVLLDQNKKGLTYQKGHPSGSRNNDLRYDRLDHWVVPQIKQTRCASCHQKTDKMSKV